MLPCTSTAPGTGPAKSTGREAGGPSHPYRARLVGSAPIAAGSEFLGSAWFGGFKRLDSQWRSPTSRGRISVAVAHVACALMEVLVVSHWGRHLSYKHLGFVDRILKRSTGLSIEHLDYVCEVGVLDTGRAS